MIEGWATTCMNGQKCGGKGDPPMDHSGERSCRLCEPGGRVASGGLEGGGEESGASAVSASGRGGATTSWVGPAAQRIMAMASVRSIDGGRELRHPGQ